MSRLTSMKVLMTEQRTCFVVPIQAPKHFPAKIPSISLSDMNLAVVGYFTYSCPCLYSICHHFHLHRAKLSLHLSSQSSAAIGLLTGMHAISPLTSQCTRSISFHELLWICLIPLLQISLGITFQQKFLGRIFSTLNCMIRVANCFVRLLNILKCA